MIKLKSKTTFPFLPKSIAASALYLMAILLFVTSSALAITVPQSNNAKQKNSPTSNLPTSQSPISVKDDAGHTITLAHPAQRIVSLAPHITELLYQVGAGKQIVGVSAYSNYPAAAKTKALVGDSQRLDVEKIIALHPDLIVAWDGGNNARDLAALKAFSIPIYYQRPGTLDDLPHVMENLGQLAGTEKIAKQAASAFTTNYHQLKQRYSQAQHNIPQRVFFGVWSAPLMTLGKDHYVNEILKICGDKNIFNDQTGVITVDAESVIKRNPDIIIVDETDPKVKNYWQQWSTVNAVKNQHILMIPGDELWRYSPRLLNAAKKICAVATN